MISKAELDQQIIALVARFRNIRESAVSLDTTINFDLGIDGADADDLVETIANALGWLLDDFDYDEYFFQEGEITNPLYQLSWLFRRHRKSKKPLTVGMLSQMFFDSRRKSDNQGRS